MSIDEKALKAAAGTVFELLKLRYGETDISASRIVASCTVQAYEAAKQEPTRYVKDGDSITVGDKFYELDK